MKNALMIIVSLVVGYSLAYLSASNEWPPFSKPGEKNQPKSMSMGMEGQNSSMGSVMLNEVTPNEMKAMSDNYINWMNQLMQLLPKGSDLKIGDLKDLMRGGKISADIIDRLANSNKDIYYIFGKRSNSDKVCMLISDPTASVSAETPGHYYSPSDGDTAPICPCVCPELIVRPPYCPNDGSDIHHPPVINN